MLVYDRSSSLLECININHSLIFVSMSFMLILSQYFIFISFSVHAEYLFFFLINLCDFYITKSFIYHLFFCGTISIQFYIASQSLLLHLLAFRAVLNSWNPFCFLAKPYHIHSTANHFPGPKTNQNVM